MVEVSRHRYGGRLVSVHSNIQLVNSSGLALQLGYLSPMGLSAQPLLLATLAPGETVWLPLQVGGVAPQGLHAHLMMVMVAFKGKGSREQQLLHADHSFGTCKDCCLTRCSCCIFCCCHSMPLRRVMQVLQATTPSLCLRPAELPCTYNWCRPMDVHALLPDRSVGGPAATSGFWYDPEPAAATPRPHSQFVTFSPQVPDSNGASAGVHSTQAGLAAGAAAVGSLVLALGASASPWPSGAAVQTAGGLAGASHSGSVYSRGSAAAERGIVPGVSAASMLWQLVVEPAAVLLNQLPVAVDVSVLAGKGEVRGLVALVDSRQQLPLYGCEAAYFSKLQVQVPGFHSSPWISLNTTGGAAGSSGSRSSVPGRPGSDPGAAARHASSSSAHAAAAPAAAGGGARHSDAAGGMHPGGAQTGGAAGAAGASAGSVPSPLQLLEQKAVVLSGLQGHQPPQVLQLRTCRNKLTGCLTITLSCSLWLFNCLGAQVAIRQACPAAEAALNTPSTSAGTLPAPTSAAAGAPFSSNGSSQVLWLPPYPWMSGTGQGSNSDLASLGAVQGGAGAQGATTLASAWARAGRHDGSAASSQSALQRSRSTPSLVASTAGLEFLAVHTARQSAVTRASGSMGGLPPTAPPHMQQQQQQWPQPPVLQASVGAFPAQSGSSSSHQAGAPHNASPFAAVSGGAGNASGSSNAAAMTAWPPAPLPQHRQQGEELQLPVRRSFSAGSAQIRQLSPSGSFAAVSSQQPAQQGAGTQDYAEQQEQEQSLATATAAGPEGSASTRVLRPVRTRRHSSGLHMLASGKLPQQLLLPQLQVPDSSSTQAAACTSFDLLSPTHQQRLLQQMHLQQAALVSAAAQLPRPASGSDLASSGGVGQAVVVMPLMKQDMTGWLPLLAGGDLEQLSRAAAALAAPIATAAAAVPDHTALTYAAAASQAALQQRVAAAAAAADHLLAALPGEQPLILSPLQQQQQQQRHHPEQIMQRLGSPPMSLSHFAVSPIDGLFREETARPGRPGSHSVAYSQYSTSGGAAPSVAAGPGLASLAASGHSVSSAAASAAHQPGHPRQGLLRRPSGSWGGGGFADLAAAASIAPSSVSEAAGGIMRRGPGGGGSYSHGGGTAPAGGYAASYRSAAPGVDAVGSAVSAGSAAAAVPVMCGWPVHLQEASGAASSSSSKSSSAAFAAAAVAAAASACSGSIELQLCAPPAGIAAASQTRGLQQLPLHWSLAATVPLMASQTSPGPCTIVKLPLTLPGSSAAAAGGAAPGGSAPPAASSGGAGPSAPINATPAHLQGDSTGATAAARRRGHHARGGRAAAAAGQQEQGACFVSVHTAVVPGGGGAWAVHLLPTYLLVNTLASEVQLRQYDSELVLQTVAPGGHCCVLWPNAALPLKLQFRVDEPGWSWSGAASVDAPGEFLVK